MEKTLHGIGLQATTHTNPRTVPHPNRVFPHVRKGYFPQFV